jgi:hypothetical protein
VIVIVGIPFGLLSLAELVVLACNRKHPTRWPFLAVVTYLAGVALFLVFALGSGDPLGFAWIPVIATTLPWYFLMPGAYGQTLALGMALSTAINCLAIYILVRIIAAADFSYPRDSSET